MTDSILTRARPLVVARLAAAGLGIAVPMVLARVLVPSSYGTFKQAWLISQTLALMLPLGLTMSLYYFVPRDPARRHRYVAQILWVMLLLGAGSAALVLAGRPLVAAHFGNEELTRNLGWVAAFTAFQLAGAPLDVAWNASGRVGAAALVRVATEVSRGVAMIVGARLTGTVEGVFAGIAVATGARAVATWLLLAREHGLRGDRALLKTQFAYALPFGVAFLLIVPQQQFHHYAVGATVTAAAFAVYSVGTFQLPIVDILYTPVSELLQIGLAEAEGAGKPARAGLGLFHEAILQLSFVFLPVAGILIVVAPALIELLFSAQYASAAPIFRVAVASVVLNALPLDGVMRARAQNRFMLVLSGVKLALTVPLVIGGLRAGGPMGALVGWVVAEAVSRVVMLARAATLFEASWREVIPVAMLARQLAGTLVAMPAAWVVLELVSGPLLLRLIASGGAFAGAYVGLAWARGWLPAGWIAVFRARRAPHPEAATESRPA